MSHKKYNQDVRISIVCSPMGFLVLTPFLLDMTICLFFPECEVNNVSVWIQGFMQWDVDGEHSGFHSSVGTPFGLEEDSHLPSSGLKLVTYDDKHIGKTASDKGPRVIELEF